MDRETLSAADWVLDLVSSLWKVFATESVAEVTDSLAWSRYDLEDSGVAASLALSVNDFLPLKKDKSVIVCFVSMRQGLTRQT